MKAKQNFTLPTITNSSYTGEFAGQYIAASLLSAKTLDNKYVEIHPNVKFKEVIQKLDVNGITQDASCDFVTSGSVALSERVLTPKELQVNLQLCKQEFVSSWEALQLGFSAFDTIPASFNDYLISYVGGKVAEATERSIWQGAAVGGAPVTDVSINGEFVGFEARLSGSINVGGAGAVISAKSGSTVISGSVTSANVLSIFNSVVDSIPDPVYGKEDLLLYVGTGVAKAYQTALGGGAVGANGYNNQLTVGEKPYNFNGIDIVMCPGMSPSKIVAAQKSNLFFGTGLLSDYNEVKVLDMANIDGSQNYRVIMRYTAATQFGIGEDIVYFGAF